MKRRLAEIDKEQITVYLQYYTMAKRVLTFAVQVAKKAKIQKLKRVFYRVSVHYNPEHYTV